jgi:hypothetical protein
MAGALLLDGSRSEAKADRAAADFRKSSFAGISCGRLQAARFVGMRKRLSRRRIVEARERGHFTTVLAACDPEVECGA